MFENLVNQIAAKLIFSDIKNHIYPGAVLFSGNEASGKLTAALDIARSFSCMNNPKGEWVCECKSCLQHRALTCSNLLLLGPRNCSLEISAAKESFIDAYKANSTYLMATRYLFLRSIRKLTLRFSPILCKSDNNLSKMNSLLELINESLEILDFPRNLPPLDELEKICQDLVDNAIKLEKDFLYDSIPISHIRNMEEWARIKSEFGKKTVILENAEMMSESVRNALLKILEEPPSDCNFILLTSKRNAILPTIISRVRTYEFKNRSLKVQSKVISVVFHKDNFEGTISDFLKNYLPVPIENIKEISTDFYTSLIHGKIPDLSSLIKTCNQFEPRIELKLFLNNISDLQKPLLKTQIGCEAALETTKILTKCWENITIYNQSVTSAFEILVRDLNKINVTHGRILCADM